jgi:integrase
LSIERVERGSGVVWRVRWRDGSGRNRSKVVGRKRDAEAFDAEVRRLKRTRELGRLDAGMETLADFGQEWWRLHAEPNLSRKTLQLYAYLWDTHVLPRLGGWQLRDLTPDAIQGFRLELEDVGAGTEAVRKSLTLLHGVLGRAVAWQRIATNPAAAVRKPAPTRRRAVVPLPPAVVEAIRNHMLAAGRLGDAALVSILAYTGLRPGEALALTWAHVRRRTLLVEAAASLGEIRTTKTGTARTVQLLEPVRLDLAEWQLATGRPGPDALVFPRRDGKPWTLTDWQNWRRRVYIPAGEAAGIAKARPYDLRHSFVSLLIHEGRSVVEIARQAGHAPTMTLGTYAHVFDEFALEDRLPAEEQIRRARAKDVPVSYLKDDGGGAAREEIPAKDQWAVRGSNARPPACKAGALTS